MTTLIFVLVALLGMAPTAHAHFCESAFKLDFPLPQELKITDKLLNHSMQLPAQAQFISGLARSFWVLEDVTESTVLAELLSEHLASDESLEMRLRSFNSKVLKPEDVVILAALLEKTVPTSNATLDERYRLGLTVEAADLAMRRLSQNADQIFDKSGWHSGLLSILEIPEVRENIRTAWSETNQGPHPLTDALFAQIAKEITLGKLRKDSKGYLRFILGTIVFDVRAFGRSKAGFGVSEKGHILFNKIHRTGQSLKNVILFRKVDPSIDRQTLDAVVAKSFFRQFLEAYLTKRLKAKTGVEELVDLLDFLMREKSFPPSRERLRVAALEAGRRMLLPLKSEFSKGLGAQQREKQSQTNLRAVTPFVLNQVDHFEPRSSPHIREAAYKEVDAKSVKTPSLSVMDRIQADRSLRVFTTYVDRPRAVSELEPLKRYELWFLRDQVPRLESVRFSVKVLEWMSEHPVDAQNLVNALHMGRARDKGQAGIKLMSQQDWQSTRAFYELKIQGPFRGSLFLVDGTWQFLDVVHKDDQLRSVDSLQPLDLSGIED